MTLITHHSTVTRQRHRLWSGRGSGSWLLLGTWMADGRWSMMVDGGEAIRRAPQTARLARSRCLSWLHRASFPAAPVRDV